MAKKSKAIPIILIVLIIGIVSGLFFFTDIFQQTGLGDSCIGGSSYTITSANIIKSNNLNGKEVLQIQARANQGGECAKIIFNKNTINSLLDGVSISQEPVLDVILREQKEIFTAREDSSRLVERVEIIDIEDSMSLSDKGSFLFTGTGLNVCNSKASQFNYKQAYAKYTTGFTNLQYWCVVGVNQGTLGDIREQSQSQSIVDFIFDGSSKATIKNNERTTAFIGSSVFIRWEGNLISTNRLDRPNNEILFSNNQIKIVSSNSFNTISSEFTNFKQCLQINSQSISTETRAKSCRDSYNNKLSNLLADKKSTFQNSNPIIESVSISGNNIIANLKESTSFPVFTIEVDAEKVGIIRLAGQPKISSCQSDININSQDVNDVSIRVKNIGSNGIFETVLVCGGVTQESLGRTSFKAGEEKSVSGKVTIASDKDVSKDCLWEVRDINSNEKDICFFNLNVKARTDCGVVGTQFCDINNANQLLTCKEDGSFAITQCEFGCAVEDGKSICKGEEEPPIIIGGTCEDTLSLSDLTIIPSFDKRPTTATEKTLGFIGKIFGGGEVKQETSCLGTIGWIAFGLAIISLLLIPILSYSLFRIMGLTDKKKGKITLNNLFFGIVSLIIGFVVYALLLNYVIVGFGLFIIISAIRLFIPKKYGGKK